MRFALTLILAIAAGQAVAGPSGLGGIPGYSGRLPPIGPPPPLRGPAPQVAPVRPPAAPGVPLGVTPLEQALRTPAPRVDPGRSAEATQRAVDELMEDLGVERPPNQGPPPEIRCARWDRNLQACLDGAGPHRDR